VGWKILPSPDSVVMYEELVIGLNTLIVNKRNIFIK
jgi:hypothetical protein